MRNARVLNVAARATHMMGAEASGAWAPEQALAWEGLLEVSRLLRRGAESVLERDELSVSMLGILGRLLLAERRTLRQTELAEAMGLSLSRVSRVLDLLERRALVERKTCPTDARASNVTLTAGGARRATRAQAQLFEYVQRAYYDRLSADERSVLSAVFTRLLAGV